MTMAPQKEADLFYTRAQIMASPAFKLMEEMKAKHYPNGFPNHINANRVFDQLMRSPNYINQNQGGHVLTRDFNEAKFEVYKGENLNWENNEYLIPGFGDIDKFFALSLLHKLNINKAGWLAVNIWYMLAPPGSDRKIPTYWINARWLDKNWFETEVDVASISKAVVRRDSKIQLDLNQMVCKTADNFVLENIESRHRQVGALEPWYTPAMAAAVARSAADEDAVLAARAAADQAAADANAAEQAAIAQKAVDDKLAADKKAADDKAAADKKAADDKAAADKAAADKAIADKAAADKEAADNKIRADWKAAADKKAAEEKAAADKKAADKKSKSTHKLRKKSFGGRHADVDIPDCTTRTSTPVPSSSSQMVSMQLSTPQTSSIPAKRGNEAAVSDNEVAELYGVHTISEVLARLALPDRMERMEAMIADKSDEAEAHQMVIQAHPKLKEDYEKAMSVVKARRATAAGYQYQREKEQMKKRSRIDGA